MVAMIALCFCKFTLIYYFIYMNLLCSPSTGQRLVASIEANGHIYVLSILAKSPSQTQMLWTCCVLKGVIWRSLVTEALADTHICMLPFIALKLSD